MNKKPRRGRPRLGSGRAKSKAVLLRLDDDEKQAFSEAAAIAGVPLAVWMRERMRSAARRELIDSGRQVAFLSPQKKG